jgi:hypothetical protein
MGRSACNCCGCVDVSHYCNPWINQMGGLGRDYYRDPGGIILFEDFCKKVCINNGFSEPINKDFPKDIYVNFQSKTNLNSCYISGSFYSDINPLGYYKTSFCNFGIYGPPFGWPPVGTDPDQGSVDCYKRYCVSYGVDPFSCKKSKYCEKSGKYMPDATSLGLSQSINKYVKLYKGKTYTINSKVTSTMSRSKCSCSQNQYGTTCYFGEGYDIYGICNLENSGQEFYHYSSNFSKVSLMGPFKLCQIDNTTCCSETDKKNCVSYKRTSPQADVKNWILYEFPKKVDLQSGYKTDQSGTKTESKTITIQKTGYYLITANTYIGLAPDYEYSYDFSGGGRCPKYYVFFGLPFQAPLVTKTATVKIKDPVIGYIEVAGIEPEDYCDLNTENQIIMFNGGYGFSTWTNGGEGGPCSDFGNNFNYYGSLNDLATKLKI